jgi:hypothetical protein
VKTSANPEPLMSASVCSGFQSPAWTWMTACNPPEASENHAPITSLVAWWPSPVASVICGAPLHGAGAAADAPAVAARAETAETAGQGSTASMGSDAHERTSFRMVEVDG